ncbi:MAG: Brp/Blh family beta-carotene 15,15'-dioxygenase [Wenzhouxiangella sp.]
MLGTAVIVLGLPHGALDSWIAKRAGLYRRPLGWLGFNLAYLGLALTIVLGWWLSPVLALTLFLLISAAHFSGDWHTALSWWQRLAAGIALLGLPAVFQLEAVAGIFMVLSGSGAAAVADGLRWAGLVALVALVPVLARAAWRKQFAVLTELLLLLILAAAVPPLIYFALYFCLLHSPRHLRSTYEQTPLAARSGLIREAAVYTSVTLLLAGLLAAFFLPFSNPTELALQLLFIGLAALTVPHMLLIAWTERRAQAQPSETP